MSNGDSEIKNEDLSKTMTSAQTNILAIIIGPLALVPGLALVLTVVLIIEGQWSNLIPGFGIFLMASLLGLVIAYPAALVYGLPVIFILRRIKCFSLFPLILISFVPCTLYCIANTFEFYLWSFFAWCSASVAMGCWLVINRYES